MTVVRRAALWLFFAVSLVCSKNARSNDRKITILNESGAGIEIYWIHPTTGELSLMTNPIIFPGADYVLNSFVSHSFKVVEVPGKSGSCRQPGACGYGNFAVSINDDQVVRIDETFQCNFVDSKIKATMEASEMIETCQIKARERLLHAQQAGSHGDEKATLQAIEDLVGCVKRGVATRLEEVNEEIAFQANVRTGIAGLLENYTCLDDSLESSEDVDTRTWYNKADRKIVHVKHERPASKIHLISNFIQADECAAMEAAAKPKLHKATVADGKGGSRLSENRKAHQAGVKVPWDQEKKGDPIARVSRRVYDYVNHVLDLDIHEHGQEDLMSIQYFGRGMNDTEPDRYTPHCDGDCTGLSHKTGTRMATMVMYCTVADKGGHTNFRNAGVHVKPTQYDAVFFSYINPDTKVMDTGFTEHSGCPVFEGEKKIVTQWVRYGVDAENPWDSFNTLGVKKSEVEDYEVAIQTEDDKNNEL